jgi:hypothetical protein
MKPARLVVVLAALLTGSLLPAQGTSPAHPPIPSTILSAQKVFLANGGSDPISAQAFQRAGQVNEPYASLYNALQSWGHWQLVSSPGSADLVLTVRFAAPVAMYDKGMPLGYAPELGLTITEVKTNVALWTLTEPVKGAFRKATWEKNYADGVAGIVAELKSLTTPAAP